MRRLQMLLGNGDLHVSAPRNPGFRLHRVLACAVDRFDMQVLLDPFEEQLHLPALAIQIGDQLGLQCEVVDQRDNSLAAVVLDDHAADGLGIVRTGVERRQDTCLVADRTGVVLLEFRIALGAHHTEVLGLSNRTQTPKIQIPPVQQIERLGLYGKFVKCIDIVRLAIDDVNERRNRALQIQKGVKTYRSLSLAKRRLRKHRQTQIDGQRLAIGQLDEGHGEELIQAGEVLDFEVALMRGHASTKGAQRQMHHELREDELTLVHGGNKRKSAQNRDFGIRCSNRDQTEVLKLASKSLTYDDLM